MWVLMIVCYLLMAGSWLALATTGVLGYTGGSIGKADHQVIALCTIILYMFTETLVMWFFIGTGINIKDYIREHDGDPALYEKVKAMKHVLFPKMMASILYVGVTAIAGGAVHRGYIPDWLHGLMFIGTLAHFTILIRVQHQGFRQNTGIILDMCGVENPMADQKE